MKEQEFDGATWKRTESTRELRAEKKLHGGSKKAGSENALWLQEMGGTRNG